MITKLKARLSNAKSNPLPETKNTGSDDEDSVAEVPSLMATLSATLSNPKRLIGEQEMVHAILLGIQGTNTKFFKNKSNDDKIDLTKLSIDELQKNCKTSLKIECPSCGSDNTHSHNFTNFDFEIYAPLIFESLRIHFNIQTQKYSNEFLYKLCGISSKNNTETDSSNSNSNSLKSLELYTSFWKTLITNSKSGQLFYKTKDSLFIIKSMSNAEYKFLKNNLHKYYQYMTSNKDSLICQFLGLYKVNIQYQKSVFVLIQKSVLYSHPKKLKMNKLYDLKGSTFGRQATRWKVELAEDDMAQMNSSITDSIRNKNVDAMIDEIKDIDYNNPAQLDHETHFDEQFSPSFYIPDVHEADSLKSYKSTDYDIDSDEKKGHKSTASMTGAIFKRSKILKDLDFLKDKQAIIIGKKRRKLWLEQFEKDTNFLRDLKVMDYSLLLGMHYRADEDDEQKQMERDSNNRWIVGTLFHYDHGGMSYNELDDNIIDENNEDDDNDIEQSWSDENNLTEQLKNCIYFGGIIDILQPYNTRKKAENFLLGFKTDKATVSAVGPHVYSKRLVAFMQDGLH